MVRVTLELRYRADDLKEQPPLGRARVDACCKTTRSTPHSCSAADSSSKCCRLRPSRSSFVTTSVSPARSSATARSSSRRDLCFPEACSTNNRSQPSACTTSACPLGFCSRVETPVPKNSIAEGARSSGFGHGPDLLTHRESDDLATLQHVVGPGANRRRRRSQPPVEVEVVPSRHLRRRRLPSRGRRFSRRCLLKRSKHEGALEPLLRRLGPPRLERADDRLHAIAIARWGPPPTTAFVALRSRRPAPAHECLPSKAIVRRALLGVDSDKRS